MSTHLLYADYIIKYTAIFCCLAKDSHIFPTKNISIIVLFTFFQNFNKTLTNVVINFEQLAPDFLLIILNNIFIPALYQAGMV